MPATSTAAATRPNLRLPGLQQHLLETAASFGKPLIVITLAGSALALDWAEEHAAAVVHGSYPGALGGWALAQLIFGFSDFSGRLPVTFYSAQNHLPPFEDYAMQGRTYRFMQEKPLYPLATALAIPRFPAGNLPPTAPFCTRERILHCPSRCKIPTAAPAALLCRSMSVRRAAPPMRS